MKTPGQVLYGDFLAWLENRRPILKVDSRSNGKEVVGLAWTVWQAAIAHDRANQPAASGVPEGWRLVPIEPTWEMLERLRAGSRRDVPSDQLCLIRWTSTLAAAPEAPKP